MVEWIAAVVQRLAVNRSEIRKFGTLRAVPMYTERSQAMARRATELGGRSGAERSQSGETERRQQRSGNIEAATSKQQHRKAVALRNLSGGGDNP